MKTFLKAAAGVSIFAMAIFGIRKIWEKHRIDAF